MSSSSATVTFYDQLVPSLPLGEYRLDVTQTLSGVSDDKVTAATASQKLVVKGPRFSLPASDIHRVFPPRGTTGAWDQHLPMVVFSSRSVPWERSLEKLNYNGKPPLPWETQGQDDERPKPPWMALIVLTEEDLADPVPGPPSTTGDTVRTLADLSSGGAVEVPVLHIEDDEKDIQIRTIDLKADRFAAVMPTLREVRLLAHVREVSGAEKEQALMAHDGRFSTLIANRFGVPPSANATRANFAHLVSLEGLEELLDRENVALPEKPVRLISLASWRFLCTRDPIADFRTRMSDLVTKSSECGTGLLLRMPPPTTHVAAAVRARMDAGYVALQSRVRSGQTTLAWYRGPFAAATTPRSLKVAGPDQPQNTLVPLDASQAMRVDSATGVFDNSYAVAFEVGRTHALASRPFSVGLHRWRRGVNALIDLLLERLRVQTKVSGDTDLASTLSQANVNEMRDLLDARLFTDKLSGLLASEVFQDVSSQIGRAGGFTGADVAIAAPALHGDLSGELSTLFADAGVSQLIGELTGLDASGSKPNAALAVDGLVRWLAQLALLHGVPLDHLVPHEAMLPPESIRFFCVDRDWIAALLDGALSIGLRTGRDTLLHRLTRDRLHRAVSAALGAVRAELSGLPPQSSPPPPGMSGLLLRSAVVRDCKGIEVSATWTLGGKPQGMKPLRFDRLAPDILLAIFPEQPTTVQLNEPTEGLVFGLDKDDKDHSVFLQRSPLGTLTGNSSGPVLRSPDSGVLDVLGMFRALLPNPDASQGPAHFGLQLIRVPEEMTFNFQVTP